MDNFNNSNISDKWLKLAAKIAKGLARNEDFVHAYLHNGYGGSADDVGMAIAQAAAKAADLLMKHRNQ